MEGCLAFKNHEIEAKKKISKKVLKQKSWKKMS